VQCHLSNKEEEKRDNKTTISTTQKEKIPSYLFSFGVASLMSADRRTRANQNDTHTGCHNTVLSNMIVDYDLFTTSLFALKSSTFPKNSLF